MVVNRFKTMGARGGGGSRGGGGGAGAPTAGQVKAAYEQYKTAKAGYDAAAKELNNAVAQMVPGGPKIDYQKVQNKFQKASDKLDKAHEKWSKLKTAKKIADIRGGSSVSPKSGISYAGVSTSTNGWNAEMKSTYKAMTTKGGYSSKVAKQIINSQKNVYQGSGGENDIPLF